MLSTLDELIFRAAQCFINEEIVVPISFVLAVPSSTKNEPVTKVLTHPHAAAQCKEFIKANKIEVEFTASTADACRIVAERKEPGLAKKIMNALSNAVYEIGHKQIVLQVLKSNVAAIGLYKSLGYEIHHDYAYYRHTKAEIPK